MSKQIFGASGLTGGTAGKLDDILHTSLEDGNLAVTLSTSADITYFHKYSSSEAGAESSPDIIIPDSNTSGTGAWVLIGIHGSTITGDSIQVGGAGATLTEFSTDGTLAGDSDTAAPTEKAVKTYVDNYCDEILTTKLDIGDWDMDAASSHNVAHGLTFSKIIGIESVLIVNDANTVKYPLNGIAVGTTTAYGGYTVNATNVALTRATSGQFDSSYYSSPPSSNRGVIIVRHIA